MLVAGPRWNNYTSFLTSGAGSVGSTTDSCGGPGTYFYSGGGARALLCLWAASGHHRPLDPAQHVPAHRHAA